jgi:hypothetical protein
MTSLFLCWRSTAEKIAYFYRIYPKENIVYAASCTFFIRKTDGSLLWGWGWAKGCSLSITGFWYRVNGARQKKVNPVYEGLSERWRCGYIASSIWIHKVAVYDIMAISWGAQTTCIGLLVCGRVDKGTSIYNLLHTWPVSQPNIHGTSCT